MLNLNNAPAQHLSSDDLPLPELPGVIGSGKSRDDDSLKIDGDRMKSGSNDLLLQYSIEEEDDGSSQLTSQTATLTSATDTDSCQLNNSEC